MYSPGVNSTSVENGTEGSTMNKRQRLFNLVRNTKNTYMQGWTSSFYQRDSLGNDENQGYGNLPLNMEILFYPTYTTKIMNGYETIVRLAVCAPGNPAGRRNRFLLSLCKQFLKPMNSDDFENKFDSLNRDDQSSLSQTTSSSNSSLSSFSARSSPGQDEVEVLKSRISGFMLRKVPNLPIIVDLVSHEQDAQYETAFANTDNLGNVSLRMFSSFLPKKLRITLDTPTDFPKVITQQFPCDYIEPTGYGVISDIDDTIKHTGVTGDKRSMFRSVFLNDIDSWLIHGVSRWYNSLKEIFGADFFYVSNSPVQTYPALKEYVTRHFPKGPLFLKQYSGNLLASIMTSSSNRKMGAITQIFKDFPHKKFILIGDSGELDFETYVSVSLHYPEQVTAIYIRCCKDSMSDLGLREAEVMQELNEIINEEYLMTSVVQETENSESRKSGPPVPSRKPKLTPEQEREIFESRKISLAAPALPPRPRPTNTQDSDTLFYYTPSTQNDYGTYSSFFDKRGDNWRNRVKSGVRKLKDLQKETAIRVMFFTDPELPLEDYIRHVKHE
ncbi:hypothetical protein HG537_0B02510 [Torulaspora globosa]|uniref:Phosphatidate phosphatase APP1 catalytic domain-containing protein n=1 Tax=Torulaspora globosa TaxID=48254 RepID=A0A7H9HNN5_9SACH|nr:hypothetical protein HG537_0B02510 [Torulaspora sp. CBS 2947]